MNLIEQAAKRLAELQRAGAQITSTSEKAVSQVDTPHSAAVRFVATGHAALPSGLVPGATLPTFTPVHKAELDFEGMKALGLVTPDHAESWTGHEMRILKRPILRNAKSQTSGATTRGNFVMVTSAVPGEGKTFTAANLALSIAMEVEDSVLLVDGDVAHPTLLDVLGVPQSRGLLDLLTDTDVALEDVVLQTNLDRLLLLPAGSRHRRATELIASDRMIQLMTTLATRLPGRIIVFDSPPLLPTTESRVLATHMGQVVMVVAADSTACSAVEEALAAIERCECVMMVLNKAVSFGAKSYYGYGY